MTEIESTPSEQAHAKTQVARGNAFLSRIEKALLSLKGRRATVKSVSGVETAKVAGGDDALFRHFEEYAWARSAVAWLIAATGVILLQAVIILVGVVVVATRPQGLVVSEPSLSDVVREEMNKGYVSNRDSLEFYTSSVLGIINDIDKSGSQMEMLRGLVSPEVYDRVFKRVTKNLPTIRRNLISQSLTVESIGNIVQSADGNRVSVYVRGTLSIVQEMGEKGPTFRKVPYRAKLICDAVIPTSSNHQHFYLVDLEERVGAKASDWDLEQAKETK